LIYRCFTLNLPSTTFQDFREGDLENIWAHQIGETDSRIAAVFNCQRQLTDELVPLENQALQVTEFAQIFWNVT